MAKVRATDPAIAVRTVMVNELDSPELSDSARQAGLLVLGRRGDGGQVAFSLGSTSAELARRFHCPMLLVHDKNRPGQAQRFGPDRAVVAGMDFAEGADAVLGVAVNEAVLRGLPLVVVHALRHGKGVDSAGIADGWRRYRAALREARLPADARSRLVITLVKGNAQEVNRLYDALDAVELLLFPWHSAPKTHFIRIEPDSITGYRFEVTGGSRSAVLPDPPSDVAYE